jgi:hypothetical protein
LVSTLFWHAFICFICFVWIFCFVLRLSYSSNRAFHPYTFSGVLGSTATKTFICFVYVYYLIVSLSICTHTRTHTSHPRI